MAKTKSRGELEVTKISANLNKVLSKEKPFLLKGNGIKEKGSFSVKESVIGRETKLTNFEKMALAEMGIKKKNLEQLKEKAGLDYDQLAKLLSVARATLINKKGDERFNQSLSERIVGLADIYSYGYEVFEDRDRFNDWVFRSNQALGGKAPFDVLHNAFGREEVRNIIGRIDYGIYS